MTDSEAPKAELLRRIDRIEALVARYAELVDHLAVLAAHPSDDRRRAATVTALVKFLTEDVPPASLALVQDLLSPQEVQRHNEFLRGMIAAAVAILRSAAMSNPQIIQWLDDEIKKRPALDFKATNAVRWFRDCNGSDNSPVPENMLKAFRDFCPDPSLALAETKAKNLVTELLDGVADMKVSPLIRSPRDKPN